MRFCGAKNILKIILKKYLQIKKQSYLCKVERRNAKKNNHNLTHNVMKKVTLIIRKNQNNVTASEIARIKRNIRKQFDGKLRFTTLANNAADSVIDSRTGYVNLRTQYIDVQNSYMVIETSDVNYKFTAEVCEVSSDLRNTNLSDFLVSWKY